MSNAPVHILGIGNLAKLLAHSLRKHYPDLPITLLFHRPSLAEEWDRAGKTIEIVRNGVSDRQKGFLHEDVFAGKDSIHQLIVATKTHATVEALRPLQTRLSASSTLLFLQNGIGTIDEVTDQVFDQPPSRPIYLSGIFNHGVYATSTFSSVHAGMADAVIGPISSSNSTRSKTSNDPNTMDLAQNIVECPELATTLVTASEILQIQLQKLTINAVINPLTVIFDCMNGDLFTNTTVATLIERQIAEISAVIQAIIATQAQPSDIARFVPERLYEVVFEISRRTAKNISSMRQDRRAGRRTEIDYINGYIVAQGEQYGIACPLNEKIVQLVKEEKRITATQIEEIFFS